jgi:chromosome segregation ATPase
MIGVAERIARLEDEVQQLQTWAGPGQVQALLDGQRELRSDMAKLQATVDRHERLLVGLKNSVTGVKGDVTGLKSSVTALTSSVTGLTSDLTDVKTDVASLKTDVADLKTDVADLKVAVAEILRRLPVP